MSGKAERWPRQETSVLDITLGDGDGSRIAEGSVIPSPWRWTGCPCGCRTKLPYLDDPDCVRHLPTPPQVDYDGHDVLALGLAPHDRGRCRECQAVGA